jgi:hypothetical protein
MKAKSVFKLDNVAFPIEVKQNGKDNFTVIYGLQVKEHLTYATATKELGQAIFHALSCDGVIDNRLKGER